MRKESRDKGFDCSTCRFSWPRLGYVYTTEEPLESSDVEGKSYDREGNGFFRFKAVDGSPHEFDGTYVYGRVGGRVNVEGRRLTPKEVAEYHRADLKGHLIRRVIGEYSGKPA